MKNNLIIMLMFSIFLIGIVTAEVQTLGDSFKQYDNINLVQSCDNSTYSNLSVVIYPNGTFSIYNETIMTKNGDNYNYSFFQNTEIGQYLVYGHCDDNGVDSNFVYDFFTKPSGLLSADFSQNIYIVLIILFFVGSIVLIVKNDVLFGGFMMFITSVILIFSKINIIISAVVLGLSVIILANSYLSRGKTKK